MGLGGPALRTAVVHIKQRGAPYADGHADRHKGHRYGGRPFLLVLVSDSLELVTSGDASDMPEEAAASATAGVHAKEPRTLVRRLARLRTGRDGGKGGDGAGSGSEAGDPDEVLEENAVLELSIALSQVQLVERIGERGVRLLWTPNKPQKTSVKQDLKGVLKTAFFPVAFPVEAWKHENWDIRAYAKRHERDPTLRSCLLEAESTQEADALAVDIEGAVKRLAAAVAWLDRGLPLLDQPVVILVSCGALLRLEQPSHSSAGKQHQQQMVLLPGNSSNAGDSITVVAAFPPWGVGLQLPPIPSGAACAVWLSTPVGPTRALIPVQLLRDSAADGGEAMLVEAVPFSKLQQYGSHSDGSSSMMVELQFSATLTSRSRSSRSSSLGQAAGQQPQVRLQVAAGGRGGSNSRLPLLSAGAVLAAVGYNLAQLLLSHTPAAAGALQALSLALNAVLALLALWALVVLLRGAAAGSGDGGSMGEEAQEAACEGFELTLLHAAVLRERRQDLAPPIKRMLSTTAASSRPYVTGDQLPVPLRRLLEQHPTILTQDVMERFLIGLGSRDKAIIALESMAQWIKAEGVEQLVSRPQPRFDIIKRHYAHGSYCWSRLSYCVVEIECTGRWRQAFDELRAQGVTEQEMMHHLLFTYEYCFNKLDPRPLPHGKTIKIIDLDGLSMRDVASDAFKFYLTKAGSLLGANYPQRLHKAVLLNAPTWSGVIWRLISAAIPKKTREQLLLFTRGDKEAAQRALLELVPAEQLPVQYGGTSDVPLSQTQLEMEMAAYVRSLV